MQHYFEILKHINMESNKNYSPIHANITLIGKGEDH